jgi:AraC-like DNA-binding protein
MDNPKMEPPSAAAAVPAFAVAESWGIARGAFHRESLAQLVVVTDGAITVETESGSFLAPHGHAVFIPPYVACSAVSRRSCKLLRLLAEPSLVAHPGRMAVLESTRLVEELLVALIEAGSAYPPGSPAERLARVLVDRIALLEARPFFLPAVRSPLLAPIVQKLQANPGRKTATLESWCAETGMSLKTAARRFESEAKMTFQRWWLRLRMLHALERLADGESITLVAHELGHPSLAAFSVAFRRALGAPPTRYANRLPR